MNAVHLMEFLVLSIALLLYIFADFRLTRLLYSTAPKRQHREALAYIGCIVLGELILLYQLCHTQYLLWVLVSVFVCHFPILFLYERLLRKNILTLLKLFGGDLVYIVVWILAEGSFENVDHELLFLTLCGARDVFMFDQQPPIPPPIQPQQPFVQRSPDSRAYVKPTQSQILKFIIILY